MLKYFNEVIICNQLTKENEELKKENIKLKEDYNELEYKYNGLMDFKKDIYKKYQDTIIHKVNE
jgi:cell division protein FtsB